MKKQVHEFVRMFNGRLKDCADYSMLVQIEHPAHGTQEAKVNGLVLDHVRECVVLTTKY